MATTDVLLSWVEGEGFPRAIRDADGTEWRNDGQSPAILAQRIWTSTTLGLSAGGRDSSGSVTALGRDALASNTTGSRNVAVGLSALMSQTIGGDNVAVGASALESNVGGRYNVAIGTDALTRNIDGGSQVAVGTNALRNATSVGPNTAIGTNALREAVGIDNTAVGAQALTHNTTGWDNVGVGSYALTFNVTGHHNVAVGESTLYMNLAGHNNVAVGDGAGHELQSDHNVAVGSAAAFLPGGVRENATTTGSRNVAVGSQSGQASSVQRSDSVALGYHSLVDGDFATALGAGAAALAAGSVALGVDSSGHGATAVAENELVLGTPLHLVRVPGVALLTGALGIGNSVAATTVGVVTRGIEVFDNEGVSLGFLAIYDAVL